MNNEMDEREIMHTARELSRVRLGDEAAWSAAAAVRERLAKRLDNRASWRPRAVLSGALAAAAVLLLILWPFGLLSSSVAQQLEQAAANSRDYRGWVHIRTHVTRATTQPAGTAPATQPAVLKLHINTIDGSSIVDRPLDGGGRHIQMRIPAQKLWYMYDSRDARLRISTLSDALATSFAEAGEVPLTAEALLQQLRNPKGGPLDVTSSREGESIRYDFTVGGDPGGKATLWVDTQTNRIRRVSWPTARGLSISEYSYGDPQFADIYEAGVPRDAQVVDGRPAPDTAEVVDRLHARVVRGFGDGVALLVTRQKFQGPEPRRFHEIAELTLYGREGNNGVAMRYAVTSMFANQSAPGWVRAVPAGWPAPSVEQTLAVLRPGAAPLEGHVIDGARTWDFNAREVRERARGVAAQSLYLCSVGSLIWPTQESLGLNAPGARVKVITDPARPGLIGLVRGDPPEIDPDLRMSQSGSDTRTYWFDPRRDDMPVESVHIVESRSPDGNGITRSIHTTKYLEYGQLPDGRWYPKRWEIEVESGGDLRPTRVLQLQIFPGATLVPDWYADPAKRFEGLATPAAR